MKTRREFLIAGSAGLCVLLSPPSMRAQQQPKKVWRIGFLCMETAVGYASRVEALRAGLRDIGYVEGKNIVIEYRFADGNKERLPKLAAELVDLKVDIIVTHGTAGLAAKRATATIPIVLGTSGEVVATGVVASLARPGGNITGSSLLNPDIAAKRIELLKEAMPRVTKVALLFNPASALDDTLLKATADRARSLRIELQKFEVRGPNDFESAFLAMAKMRVDAIALPDESVFSSNRKAFADLAAQKRIPWVASDEFADIGALIGYGVNRPELWRHASYFVDKILKGAKPGDIPVEQPTKFELVVNMKTAKALGITIPQSILVRANRVIE